VVVNVKLLEEEGAKARACASADRLEHHEALEAVALLGDLADLVGDVVNDLAAKHVAPAGKAVGGVLLATDQVVRVEELPIRACEKAQERGRKQKSVLHLFGCLFGWKVRVLLLRIWSSTDGSRSTKRALGTNLPDWVS